MDFVNDDGDNTCPLCLEEMDLTDRQLKPCKCGYEICVWCWHHVMEVAEKDNTEGRCPACRTPYDKEKIVGMTFNCERLMDASSEKKQKYQKSKSKASEMRKHLSNVRVLQRNLVYIIGIPSHLADEETLERREFFGQYGKVLKVSISRSNANTQHSSSNPTSSVYITYTKEEEAVRCIQAVHGYVLDGRPLRACFGTTKYCHAWLKNMPCNNPDCLYLHDIGTQEDSFTKEEMVSSSSCASKIPQFHSPSYPSQRRAGSFLPPPEPELSSMNLPCSSKLPVKTASNVGCQARTTIANGTVGKSTALPAAASWGLRAVQGKTLPPKTPVIPVSTKPKSSSSHTLSVSPPSYLPASAAAAAGTPMSHSDHSKPVMGSNGSQPNHCFPVYLSSNLNLKNNQMGTNVINSAGSDCSAVATAYDKYSIQDNQDENHSESNSQRKRAYQEENEMICLNTLSNSDLSGKSHVDQSEPTENLDSLFVSSGVVNRFNSQDGSQPFPCNHDGASSSTLNENSTGLHSISLGKPHLDKSIFSANVTQSDNMSCPESNIIEAIKEVSITEFRDLQRSNEAEEQISGSFAQVFSETELRTKPESSIDANKRPLDSSARMSMAESGLYSPLDPAMLKDDRRICSQLQASNTDICDVNDSRNDLAYERTGGLSYSTTYDTSCLKHLFQESCIGKEDTFSRIGVSSQQNYEGHFKQPKSQSLESNQNDKLISRDNSDRDAVESSIISDILSMNFDIWEDNSITSPHNFAKALLGDKEKTTVLSKDTSSSRKFQTAGQSRFSFAREEEASIESSRFSNTTISNGQLHNILSKGKSLDDVNGYDQMNILLNDTAASDREEYQMLTNRNASPPNMGSAGPPTTVSRSQFSAPPGFSVPIRIHPVPPPGFLPQARVDRPYESTTTSVFPNGIKDHDDSMSLKNAVPNSYSLLHETLGSNSSNDVELVDPAIMAVGRGKLPIGQIQHGSAGPDSVFSGPRQDVANSNFSQSLLGLRSPYSQQVTPMDYDARLQMLKQKSYYMNSSLMSPRQQLKFQDQAGDAFASYLSCQNDNVIQSMMMEQSQINLDPGFSQISFQQPMNSTFRSSSVGANGWDSWNRMGSGLESGLAERRLEASLMEIASKERMGLLDPKNGLNKFLPSYGEPMFHMPSSENYYSRPFEM